MVFNATFNNILAISREIAERWWTQSEQVLMDYLRGELNGFNNFSLIFSYYIF